MGKVQKDELTAKQKAFCEAMIRNNHNVMKSYAEAYPNASAGTNRRNSYKMMKQEKILNYINALEEEALRQAGITPARIANELGAQAFGELDPDNGLTYQVKQNAMKLLMSMYGLEKKVVEADIKTTVIDVNIEEE